MIESAPFLAPLVYGSDEPTVHAARAAHFVRHAQDPDAFAVTLAKSFAAMFIDPARHRRVIEDAASSDAATVARLTSDAMLLDLRGRLARITAPVHVALGAWPGVPSAAVRNARIAADLPEARITLLHGCRHFPMLEVPDALAGWALDALAAEP